MVNLELYSWVVRGTQRTAVMKALAHPMTPTQTYKKAKEYHDRISLNSTSSVLRAFVKIGLAVCVNVEKKTGRFYKLTEEGECIKDELLKICGRSISLIMH